MKKTTLSLILTFFCLVNNLYSQNKTPYQKKCDQIMTEMCRAIGVDDRLVQMAIKTNDWDFVRTSKDLAIASKMMDRNLLLGIIMTTDAKLKDAAKLKNEIDFKRDADKKAEEEEKKKLAEEQQQKAFQVQEEKSKQEEQKKLYNNSDYVYIINEVANNFNNWLRKGEYEKTENYLERLAKKESVFDNICNYVITNKINEVRAHFKTKIELQNYNADYEYYPVEITLDGKYFLDTLKIKLNDAEKFKNDMLKHNDYNQSIILPKGEENWCFVDNYLFPLKIELINSNIEIIVPITKKYTLMNLSSKELTLNNYNQEELKYEFANYLSKKYNENVLNAEKSLANGNYSNGLKFYQNANKIKNSSELSSKIDSLKVIAYKIENNYKEIAKIESYMESHYKIQMYESGGLASVLEKNKKAKENFIKTMDFIIDKYNGNEDLIKKDISQEKKDLIWTTKEEKIYYAFIERERMLNNWLQFNKTVKSLINENNLKVLKSEENPELLLQKVLSIKI